MSLPTDPYYRFLASLDAGRLNLVRDLKRDYGASGSAQTTTGSMTAGSNVLTLAAPMDFQDGQGIVVPHAGGGPYQNGSTTALLAAPSGVTIATTGTVGAGYTYTYYVVAINARGGISALSIPVSVTITESELTQTVYNTITVPSVTGASTYGLYGATTNPTGSQGWLFTSNEGGSSNPLVDRGSVNFFATQQPSWVPAYSSIPVGGLGDFLVSSVVSGGGTTTLVLADSAASSTLSGASIEHDDTVIVNAAIADCDTNGYDLYAPPGTYKTFSGITGTTTTAYYGGSASPPLAVGASLSGFSMRGAGEHTVFQLAAGSIMNVMQFGVCTDSHFHDFVCDGNWAEQVWNSYYEVQGNGFAVLGLDDVAYSERNRIVNVTCRNTGQSAFRFGMYNTGGLPYAFLTGLKDSTVNRCNALNAHDQGFAVWSCENTSLSQCLADGECWAGISLTVSTNCTVTDCVSKNQYWTQTQDVYSTTKHGFGIAVEGGSGHKITGNTFLNNMQAGVYVHTWQDGGGITASNLKISDNVIGWNSDVTYWNVPVGVWINGDNNLTISDVAITDNLIFGASNGPNNTSGYGVSLINLCKLIGITANTIVGAGNNAIGVQGGSTSTAITGKANDNIIDTTNNNQGILLVNVDLFECSNNQVSNAGNAAICIQGATNCAVSENFCYNTRGQAGIQVGGTNTANPTTSNRFTGNQCIDNKTTHTQTYGIQEWAGTSGNVYEDNTFAGNVDGPIVFASGSTSAARNNPGYNPVGALTAPTVGASPWTYTNSNNVPVTLYVSGGTVTSIAQYGVNLGLVAGAFPLEVGQSVTVTYTAAPTAALIGA